ncbi:MAG: DUF389 domain-containing protein [Flavobacteriales bacterium]|nr:DUF389 domain-containing protein [Flavobacteriales bacterium]
MDESTPQQQSHSEDQHEQQKASVKMNMGTFWESLISYLKSVLSLRAGVQQETTMEGIVADVEFRGHAAWILVCSTLIASIGLGENSIAVIIGAMLISPLMGPILGVGLAAGTNDFDLLKRALTNLGLAVFIVLFISTLYFVLNPVVSVTPELESRRTAVLTAIAIAFLGGAAGIIAGSRSHKSNVVPGVAIATALMPPLCTAGYGLASLQLDYFFGAIYLFFINSVFIAVPTYMYIKYMRFPVKQFIDPQKEKKIKRYILLFILITVIPSGVFFYQVLNRSFFQRNTEQYIADLKQSLDGTSTSVAYYEVLDHDTAQVLKLALMGAPVPEITIAQWENRLKEYNLKACHLAVFQNEDMSAMMSDIQEKSMEQNRLLVENMIRTKDQELDTLKQQLEVYQKSEAATRSILEESLIVFPELEQAGYAAYQSLDATGMTTSNPTLMVRWSPAVGEAERQRLEKRLAHWFQVRLEVNRIDIIPYPSAIPE